MHSEILNLGRRLWNTDMPRKGIGDDKIVIPFLKLYIVCLRAIIFENLTFRIDNWGIIWDLIQIIFVSITLKFQSIVVWKYISVLLEKLILFWCKLTPQLSNSLAPNRWQAIFESYFNDIHWYVVTSLCSNTFHHSDVTKRYGVWNDWQLANDTRSVYMSHRRHIKRREFKI